MSGDRVVAIDGASGSGKSTLAFGLARALDLPYVNTGSMYRALAAAAIRSGVSPDDEAALVELTHGLRFIVRVEPSGSLEVEGYGDAELTSIEVESTVSSVARHAAVRQLMRMEQRGLGEAHGAVMEGRDIASVVFPDAAVKLYLEARPDLRAARRADEREAEVGSVAAALDARDARDAITTPHAPADGAIVIDTSDLDAASTLEAAIAVVRARASELVP